MNLDKQTPAAKAPDTESGLLDWFLGDFWPRFGKQVAILLTVIAVVILGIVSFKGYRESSRM